MAGKNCPYWIYLNHCDYITNKLKRDNICLSFFLPSVHRCVLLPLLSVKPPQQSLFLLVDSIDEGCQLGEGEQRSSPGSPRTIAELLASHHEFLPPWLLLICSARRQNKAITKLFTGKQSSSSHEWITLLLVTWGHQSDCDAPHLFPLCVNAMHFPWK